MDGLMMDFPLTITAMLRRTESMFGHKEIVSRRADRSLERSNYALALGRARRLASALQGLGVGRGDRVATLCWNHLRHLEAYFGVPSSGAVLHTLNLRLHIDELTYIATHAEDVALIVDQSLVPLAEQLRQRVQLKHLIVTAARRRDRLRNAHRVGQSNVSVSRSRGVRGRDDVLYVGHDGSSEGCALLASGALPAHARYADR